MRISLAAAAFGALLSLPAQAAEFASSYAVEGKSPEGGGAYSGVVTVKKTSEVTYQVVWDIAGDKFVGTGIGGTEGLAVAYKSGSSTGIAIYREGKGGQIEGFWTYAGGKTVGEESWTPR